MPNDAVYAATKQVPISVTCRKRRLLWLGHIIREGPGSASYEALRMAIDTSDIKRPRGRPTLRWIDNIKNDINSTGIRQEVMVGSY